MGGRGWNVEFGVEEVDVEVEMDRLTLGEKEQASYIFFSANFRC